MLPTTLFLIRHGQSEGNIALREARRGDATKLNSEEFQSRPGHNWRLTEVGVDQAKLAGGFLRACGRSSCGTTHYYTSPFVRAMETAAHLGIENAQWRTSIELRERDWGLFERMEPVARDMRYAAEMRDKHNSPFYWRPPQGESLADVYVRIKSFLGTLHRQTPETDTPTTAIIVCHGEVMWTMRYALERLTDATFLELDRSTSQFDRIQNGHIFEYSRISPDGRETRPYLAWHRSIAPSVSGLDLWTDWRELQFAKHSNDDLLQLVHKHPRLFESEDHD